MGNKKTLGDKLRGLFGGNKGGSKCHCKFENGKWYCYIWDGGQEVKCFGKPGFDTREECENARCED